MVHNKCGEILELDLTSMYSLRSPAMQITNKSIMAGIIEISFSGKKQQLKLICPYCDTILDSKDKFEQEVTEKCNICKKAKPPSEILITSYIPKICTNCIKISEVDTETIEGKYLSLYSQALSKEEQVTLLALLMKKT